MALPRGTDIQPIGDQASGGQTLGSSASELAGMHGLATDQYAAISTLTLTTSLQSGFGWTTSAGFAAAVAALNSLIDMAKEKGMCA